MPVWSTVTVRWRVGPPLDGMNGHLRNWETVKFCLTRSAYLAWCKVSLPQTSDHVGAWWDSIFKLNWDNLIASLQNPELQLQPPHCKQWPRTPVAWNNMTNISDSASWLACLTRVVKGRPGGSHGLNRHLMTVVPGWWFGIDGYSATIPACSQHSQNSTKWTNNL